MCVWMDSVYLWFPPVFSEVERLRKKEMPSEKRCTTAPPFLLASSTFI